MQELLFIFILFPSFSISLRQHNMNMPNPLMLSLLTTTLSAWFNSIAIILCALYISSLFQCTSIQLYSIKLLHHICTQPQSAFQNPTQNDLFQSWQQTWVSNTLTMELLKRWYSKSAIGRQSWITFDHWQQYRMSQQHRRSTIILLHCRNIHNHY